MQVLSVFHEDKLGTSIPGLPPYGCRFNSLHSLAYEHHGQPSKSLIYPSPPPRTTWMLGKYSPVCSTDELLGYQTLLNKFLARPLANFLF